MMHIQKITEDYAVSPQIDPEDIEDIKAAGFTTIINNRPDTENPPNLWSEKLEDIARAAGLTWVANPVIGGAMTMENVAAQAKAIDESKGPVFAYCRSGNRSSVVWALAMAGKMPTDAIVEAAGNAGHQLDHLKPQLEALAASSI